VSETHVNLLVARLIDGEISHTECRKLAGLIEMSAELGREVRRELELSDLLSQKFHETRSANAFMAAMKGRFRADRSATRFVEAAVERIEKSERPRKRTAKRTMWWLLPVAACLTVIAGSFVYNARQAHRLPQQIAARIRITSPGVKVVRQGDTVIATVGMDIFVGDRVETRRNQRARIEYSDEDTWVLLDSATKIEFDAAERGRRLHLKKGRIEANVGGRGEDVPFVVVTSEAECEVKGTHFLLKSGRGQTRVEVLEGKVAFTQRADGETIEVGAGQSADAHAEGGTLTARMNRKPSKRLLSPVPLSEDGPEIFSDDFVSGMENWEPVIEGAPGEFRPLSESEAGLVEWEEHASDGDRGMVILNAKRADDRRLGIRLKRRLPVSSLIVEYWFKGDSGAFLDVCYGPGAEWSDGRDYFSGKYSSSWNIERRELIRLDPGDGSERYDHRCWYYRGTEKARAPSTVSIHTLCLKNPLGIIVTARARRSRISRVVIRELARPGVR
jgi:ferric-dicitrate binding protein FerR (iron transport regulator)